MKTPDKTFTRGDVVPQQIKIGDIHYEYDMGCVVKSEVIELPKWNGKGWEWKSKKINDNTIINYYVSHEHGSVYGAKLYTYEAYSGMKEI